MDTFLHTHTPKLSDLMIRPMIHTKSLARPVVLFLPWSLMVGLALFCLCFSTVLSDSTDDYDPVVSEIQPQNSSTELPPVEQSIIKSSSKSFPWNIYELMVHKWQQSKDLLVNETMNVNEQNQSKAVSLSTLTNSTEKNGNKPRINCKPVFRDASNQSSQLVIVNTTTINEYLQLKVTPLVELPVSPVELAANKSLKTPGVCTVLIFYLEWCPFCSAAAAHFNALGRLYPQLNVLAIDAYNTYSITMRYGVVGVPTIFLFHNNKLISRYNQSEVNVTKLVDYVRLMSHLEPVGEVNITESDKVGPLSSEIVYVPNYFLIASWCFCGSIILLLYVTSNHFRRLKEQIYNMWNEAQFQHEHID